MDIITFGIMVSVIFFILTFKKRRLLLVAVITFGIMINIFESRNYFWNNDFFNLIKT